MDRKEIKKETKKLYKQGKTPAEISKQFDIPSGTIRRWKCEDNWDEDIAKACERSVKKSERSVSKNEGSKNKGERALKQVIKDVEENPELTEKQRLFCIYFTKSFNATKAYQKAYECRYDSAAANAYRLMENDKIKTEINRLKLAKINRAMLSPDDIFQKYMDIAFSDITDFLEFGQEEVDVMGAFGPVQVEDPETGKKVNLKKMVNTVKFKRSAEVDGTLISEVRQGKDGASIKLADRMKALDWLSEHMDMATEEQKARIAVLKKKVEHDTMDDDETGVVLLAPVMEVTDECK